MKKWIRPYLFIWLAVAPPLLFIFGTVYFLINVLPIWGMVVLAIVDVHIGVGWVIFIGNMEIRRR